MKLEQELIFAPNGHTIGQVIGPCNWRNGQWLAVAYRRIAGTEGLLTSQECWTPNEAMARDYVERIGEA